MEVEQPQRAGTEADSAFDPEHPYEGPDWGIEEAAHDGAMAGVHYATQIELGVKPKHAYKLTLAWMGLKAEE